MCTLHFVVGVYIYIGVYVCTYTVIELVRTMWKMLHYVAIHLCDKAPASVTVLLSKKNYYCYHCRR